VQGRVFAVRRTIAWSTQIVAPLLAAPLADNVFKPAMSQGGVLAWIFGPLIGVGANHGIGVLISFLGLSAVLVSIAAFSSPALRNVERDLPDHAAESVPDAPAILNEPAD
jgi:MFS transporter, DHA3 family, macrolide efflux protein